MWIIGEGSDADRPDRSKFVISSDDALELGDILTIHEMRPGASNGSTLAERWIRIAMARRMPIWIIRDGARDTLLVPPELVFSGTTRQILLDIDVAVHRYHTL